MKHSWSSWSHPRTPIVREAYEVWIHKKEQEYNWDISFHIWESKWTAPRWRQWRTCHFIRQLRSWKVSWAWWCIIENLYVTMDSSPGLWSISYETESFLGIGKLVRYDNEIVYKPGKAKSAADALSRVPDNTVLNTISVPQTFLWADLRSMFTSDPYLVHIGAGAASKTGFLYSWKDGLLCYNNCMMISPTSPVIQQVLHEHHNTTMGGHSGVLRTFKCLPRQFYWPSMHKIVAAYVSQCDVCQQAKSQTISLAGLLQPLPIPDQLWEDVSMDFVDGFPKSNSHTTFMVIIDRLSKSAHLVQLSHSYTTAMVATKFIESVVKLHVHPWSILRDRDLVFLSGFW